MSLSINTTEIPSLITWFSSFIGFRDIQKRIERVESKLQGVGLDVPALNRKYYFHSTYKNLVVRNRTFGRIDIKNLNNSRAITLIAATREFSVSLDPKQKERLRARVIESLDPDRDIREFEHEMRAFIHYRGAGLEIMPSDEENDGRFDFIVRGQKGDFELECKTFSESIGNAISIDDSIHAFKAFRASLDQNRDFRGSGIVTLTVPARIDMTEMQITSAANNLFLNATAKLENDSYTIAFDKRPDWDNLLRNNNRDRILDDIAARFSQHNSHSMITISKHGAMMFVVHSNRAARPATSIFDRLKKASEQFSKRRPAMVWGHFLGFGETEFKELLEGEKLGQRNLDVFGHYLFKSPNRNHICRLRLSVDGDSFRSSTRLQTPLISPNVISGGGPAYDLTSKVSRFDPTITQ